MHVFGIDVFIHWSWFMVAVIMYMLEQNNGVFGNMLWYVAVYLSLFGIVLLHEFGHALACKSVGGRAETIVLWPLGGIAFVQPPLRPGATLWSIAAGPLVNVVLVPVTVVPLLLLSAAGQDAQRFAFALAGMNIVLLVFNLLPVYPLDGGQILQSILWFFMGRARSLQVAATIGLVVAALTAIPVLLVQEWFLFLVVLFIGWQAWNGLQYARQLGQFEQAQRER